MSYVKLSALVSELYKALQEPLFFVLQLPLSYDEEIKQPTGNGLHQEVLYLDGQTQSQIDAIMNSYGELLLRDGSTQFAIASHQTKDEIFIQTYKVVSIYSKTPEKYIPLLKKYGLRKTRNLITAWDTFSREHPGDCYAMNIDGFSAFDVARILKEQGMYRAKIVAT